MRHPSTEVVLWRWALGVVVTAVLLSIDLRSVVDGFSSPVSIVPQQQRRTNTRIASTTTIAPSVMMMRLHSRLHNRAPPHQQSGVVLGQSTTPHSSSDDADKTTADGITTNNGVNPSSASATTTPASSESTTTAETADVVETLSVATSSSSSEENVSIVEESPPQLRTTFDQAGKRLMDEQDTKRMEAMGDFDANPDSSIAQMNQMREAIRARTAAMGLEKSKVSAEYIAQRQQQAVSAGSAAAANEQTSGGTTFAGLDLSQISTTRQPSNQKASALWGPDEEELPSMFYDPEDELTAEQRAEIDPMLQKGILEQGLNELKSTKWPDPLSALREVALMFIVVAITGALIIGWDKVLRFIYTDVVHFIPSSQDLTNYMQRFDGLDLPPGWTDNMNDADISALSDTISTGVQQKLNN